MAGIKLTAADMADVEPLDEPVKAGPVKLTQADMAHISPVEQDEPERKGVLGTIASGAKAVGGAVVDTVKSFAKAVPTAIDLVSPISKSGGLQVPFGQLADGSYRRELGRGVSNVVTGGLATKAANAVSPEFAASEKTDQEKAPEARNLGEVGGSFAPSPMNWAVGQAIPVAKAVAGRTGEAIGSLARSDRRLLNDVTDGARAKLRTKLEQAGEKETADLIRSKPDLERARKNPGELLEVVTDRLAKNHEAADGVYAGITAPSSADLVKVLRERQSKLRQKASGEEMANAMEPHIRVLESRAERLAKDAPDMPPPKAAAPVKSDPSDLERWNRENPAGFDYIEPTGKVTATSEQATVAGKISAKPPEPPPQAPVVQPKGDIDGRDLRQVITDHQEQAYNYLPGAKPSVENKARQEIADALKEVLHGKVKEVSPEAYKQLKQLDRETSIYARMRAIAEYKKVNAPSWNGTRLTKALKNNQGLTARVADAGKAVVRSADEGLAAIAREGMGGAPVQRGTINSALRAGVKPATVHMLMTKLGAIESPEDAPTE